MPRESYVPEKRERLYDPGVDSTGVRREITREVRSSSSVRAVGAEWVSGLGSK
jgi:hypothetical protein